ncbi:MAG TPA: AAC(3) family N-acetyltransferase [Gammaproteobacteria bacterium]|nr:AAC(3) family N-acetyltransferase [Gammaproteobacteria bacterium]
MGDLNALGIGPGSVVIVHASLSSLGWVIGGAQTVVEALLEAVGSRGTIVMPAQSSHLGEPSHWSHPPVPPEWFAAIREHMPAYDPALTPLRGIGAVAECLLRHPRSVRSAHPLASFAANGAAADEICGQHPLFPALGDASPLGRLYDLDALVLLIGVGHDRNTSLHLAEHRADWPGKRNFPQGVPILSDGVRRWVEYEDLAPDDEDFNEIGAAFASNGIERTGRVAYADCRVVRQRAIVDFATHWMSEHRSGAARP